MLLTRTVAAASFPVVLDDVKEHLRVDGDDENAYINGLIADATSAAEEMTGRALITQTWAVSMDGACGTIRLPVLPVQSVSAISYFDANDDEQAAIVSDFYLFKDNDHATMRPKSGASWPTTICRDDALTVTFVAGYGAASDVPVEFRRAILLMIQHWYDPSRDTEGPKDGGRMPDGVDLLLGLHRLGWVK